jgi:threonine/homoserine/homoserine lactone efflux protein
MVAMAAATGFPVTPSAFAVFVLAAATLIVTPGPDTLFVLSQAVEDRAVGLRSAAGVTVGILFHTALVVVGVAAVYRTVPGAREVVRVAGALYLCYLGIQSFRSAGMEEPSTGGGLRQGFLVNALNPQVALFFLAFLPGFVSGAENEPGSLAFLGVTYAGLTAVYLGGVALLADGAAASLRSDGVGRRLDRIAGALLIALGVWVLVG